MLKAMSIRNTHRLLVLFSLASIATLPSQQPSSAAQPDTTSGANLKGGVEQQALLAESGVRELEETSRYLRRAVIDLIGEVERQDYVTVGSPNMIGSMVIPAMPTPSGQIATGDILPARKKWVDIFMSEISKAVIALTQECSQLVMPAEKQASVAQPLVELKTLIKDIDAHYQNLLLVTKGPTYENLKVGKETLAIYDDLRPCEEQLKKIYHLLKDKS
jgi:hypothetical protein